MPTPRHAANREDGTAGTLHTVHGPATDGSATRREAGIVCSDAVLCRQGNELMIRWNDGGILRVPVSWCRDIQAARFRNGTQIVARFAPSLPTGDAADGMSLMIVRLYTGQDGAFQAQEFAEILRRELGLPREPDAHSRIPDPTSIGSCDISDVRGPLHGHLIMKPEM
jgi:hypothetical protein